MKKLVYLRFGALLQALVLSAAYAADKGDAASDLPVPSHIASNSTVWLECGKTYSGTLDLHGKSDVTVRTKGDCGKASLSPGRAVSGWERWRGHIYSAPISFTPALVTMEDIMLELAHYPNRPQIWAKGRGVAPDRLQYRMPNRDLAGALLVFRANDWMIEERRIAGYESGMLLAPPASKEPFPFNPDTEFYVEGKLWMLDSPGEWAVSDGRLYLWTPDGQSPEGRVWAAPAQPAINAADSSNVRIENVRLFAAQHGIVGLNSRNLRIINSEIINSAEDGIHAGGDGLLVDNVSIANSGRNGIWGYYGSTRSVIRNSTILATGMVGMPKRSKGGIVFELGSGQQIHDNKVLSSSYIGIRVHKDALVANNLVDGACLILTDCGGIYTFARDRQPSNVRIEGNTVRNLAQRWAYGIYLDDYANGVVVTRNIIADNPSGLQIHNGFNNEITNNVFSGSRYQHVLLNETGKAASIHGNRIAANLFLSAKGVPVYRLWSVFDGANVKRFAAFDANVYAAAGSGFSEVAGTGMVSYAKWKSLLQQDEGSTLKAVMPPQRESTLRAMLEMLPRNLAGSNR